MPAGHLPHQSLGKTCNYHEFWKITDSVQDLNKFPELEGRMTCRALQHSKCSKSRLSNKSAISQLVLQKSYSTCNDMLLHSTEYKQTSTHAHQHVPDTIVQCVFMPRMYVHRLSLLDHIIAYNPSQHIYHFPSASNFRRLQPHHSMITRATSTFHRLVSRSVTTTQTAAEIVQFTHRLTPSDEIFHQTIHALQHIHLQCARQSVFQPISKDRAHIVDGVRYPPPDQARNGPQS